MLTATIITIPPRREPKHVVSVELLPGAAETLGSLGQLYFPLPQAVIVRLAVSLGLRQLQQCPEIASYYRADYVAQKQARKTAARKARASAQAKPAKPSKVAKRGSTGGVR